MQILFGLEYAHAIPDIKEALITKISKLCGMTSRLELYCADAACSIMDPSENIKTSCGHLGLVGNHNEDSTNAVGARYSIGGLTWSLPEGHRIEDYLLCWIGAYNSAFTNVVLTFNGCEIGTNLLFIYFLRLSVNCYVFSNC